MPFETKVSIMRCPDAHQTAAVKAALQKLVELIGGFESLITPGDHVLIKPNLVCGASYKTGITTNPNVIFGIAELCRELGAKQVTIAEGSAIGEDTEALSL